MGILTAIIAILGGILAASSIIIAKKPNAKELIDKLTPYQGWIGVILAFYGIWRIIWSILNVGLISNYLIWWLVYLVTGIIMFVVGFLLGYGLISQYLLEKDETAKAKGQELRLKLTKYQIPAGFTLIILGILSLLGSFM